MYSLTDGDSAEAGRALMGDCRTGDHGGFRPGCRIFPTGAGSLSRQYARMRSSDYGTGYRALRIGRASLQNRGYLITTVCDRRWPWFRPGAAAEAVAAKLDEPELWGEASAFCWVLMPDHLHILIQLGSDRSLSSLVQRVKSVTALAANRTMSRRGRVWMPGFHDRALRAEEEVEAVARYVICNPIRAGLVESADEYPYWNCVWRDERRMLF